MINDPNSTSSLPGRIDAREAGRLLGFQKHDISILIRANLLKPLGAPAPNAPKWFSLAKILELRGDEKWLNRATGAIYQAWKIKNARKSKNKDSPGISPIEA